MIRSTGAYWIIGLISLVLFILINIFVAKPVIKDIFSNNKKLSDAKTELSEIDSQKNVLIKLQKEKSELDLMNEKMNAFLPKKLNDSDFVTQISALSSQNNLSLTVIDLKNSSKNTPANESAKTTTSKTTAVKQEIIQQNNFSITEVGVFTDLLKFVQGMEVMSRLNTFKTFSLSLNADNTLSTKISGLIYFKPTTTIPESLSNITLTDTDKDKINNLQHYGDFIGAGTNFSGKADPFAGL